MNKLYAMGKNTVKELLTQKPEIAEEIFVLRSMNREDQDYFEDLAKQAHRSQVKITHCTKEKLSGLAGSDSHQGYVCALRDFKPLELKQFLECSKHQAQMKVAILDSIMDPHNLGAIIRAAECFGLDAVIWSRNRGAPLSSVALKVSAGGAFFVPLVVVANLVDAVRKMKDLGFWVIGCEKGDAAVELNLFDFAAKSAIVLGSEGQGIAPLLRKELDGRIWIPMKGRVDSLNVSQAASVAFSRMTEGSS